MATYILSNTAEEIDESLVRLNDEFLNYNIIGFKPDPFSFHEVFTFQFGNNLEGYFGTSLAQTVRFSNSLITIPNGIFDGQMNITSQITIPNSVTSVGAYAFYQCVGAQGLTIGSSVEGIGDFAFGCMGTSAIGGSLTDIYCLAPTAPTIGSNAFYNLSPCNVHVPVGAQGYGSVWEGLTVIYDL